MTATAAGDGDCGPQRRAADSDGFGLIPPVSLVGRDLLLAAYSAVNSLRSFANTSRTSGSGSAHRGSSSRLGAVVLDNCQKRLRHTAAAPANQPPALRIWRCLSRQIRATSSLSSAAKPVGS